MEGHSSKHLRFLLQATGNSRLVAAIVWLSVFYAGPASAAPVQHPFHFTEAYKLAIKLRQDADDKIFSNMEIIADWLTHYRRKHGRFPEPGTDQDLAEQFFRRYLKSNPYTSPMQKSDDELPCKVRFEYNAQLSPDRVREWEAAAPSEWRAAPGTITVITNTEDLFLIWAAGADQRPLMNSNNNKTRLVACRVHLHEPFDTEAESNR